MLEILILSLIQGITEFLPISSSSHLIVISEKANFTSKGLSIDVSLHIGSFLAVIVFFYRDILNFFENKEYFFKIIFSSLPIMITGFILLKTDIINSLRNIEIIGWTTVIFGILLYYSDKFKLEKKIEKNFTYKSALIIGLFQILALVPGVSRSGIAITAARLLNFKRYDSAKISFFLSIPTLLAVSIFGLKNLYLSEDYLFSISNISSIILSFVFSYMTIKYFLKYIKKFSLNIFVLYRIILGCGLLTIYYLK